MKTAGLKASVVIFAVLAVMTPTWGQAAGDTDLNAKAPAGQVWTANPAPVSQEEIKLALETMKGYDFGKERKFLLVLDSAIRQSTEKNGMRKKLANDLTEIALNDQLTYAARDLALRRIAHIGKGEQVKKIDALLTGKDDKVAESARRAIALIPGDRSDKVLKQALSKTTGDLQLGVINALGLRRTKIAVKDLTGIARLSDSAASRAAMVALGKIGNGAAGSALLDDIRPPDAARDAWFSAMNDAAANLAKDNKKLSGRLYERVLQMGAKSPARLAAFKGKALLDGHPEATALQALDQGEPGVEQVARELLVRGDDPLITKQLLERLNNAPAKKKVVMVEILGARRDKSALDAVSKLASKSGAANTKLRVAALSALQVLGDENTVPMLLKVAAQGKGIIGDTAEKTLVQMPIPEVDTVLLRMMTEAPDPAQKVAAIKIVAARKPKGSMNNLTKAASSDDAKVAAAAFKAIGENGDKEDLEVSLKTLTQALNEKVLKEGGRTVAALAKKNKRADAVKQIISAFNEAKEPTVKATLLGVLGGLGGEKCLKVIEQNIDSEVEKLQDSAVRALASFPDAIAVDDLLKVASNDKSEVHRVLALRGIARLLVQPSPKPAAERLDTAKRALELAGGVEEKKAVVGALADMKVPGVLALVVPLLDQVGLKDEAAAATVKQAAIAQQFDPANTAELMDGVKGKLSDEQQKSVDKALATSNGAAGSIRAYMGSQVYMLEDDTKPEKLLQQEFAPEVGSGQFSQAIWAGDDSGENKGRVDFTRFYDDTKNVTVYLQVHVWSPKEQPVKLETGSDDGMRAWLNGDRVATHDTNRSFDWWEDKADVKLKEGWNLLLLKVGQGSKDWRVAARFVDKDEKPVNGLKYSAVAPAN